METQKISRKDLQTIYNSDICDGWKNRIEEVLKAQNFNDKIEANNSIIEQAYREANTNQKKMLLKYFKIETPENLHNKISGFNDILKLSKNTLADIIPWLKPKNKYQRSQNAIAKIQLITQVYNNGTILDWSNRSQCKYYPYLEKKAHGGWALYRVGFYVCAYGPAGCYFKSEEDCRDAVSKFMDIYLDYLPE